MGTFGTFLYGFLMRLSGAVGLHHMIYPLFWYSELGDLDPLIEQKRFFVPQQSSRH